MLKRYILANLSQFIKMYVSCLFYITPKKQPTPQSIKRQPQFPDKLH